MLEGTDQMVHGLPHWGASVILRRPVSREFGVRSEEHTSELQSQSNIVCRLLLEKKNVLRTRRSRISRGGPSQSGLLAGYSALSQLRPAPQLVQTVVLLSSRVASRARVCIQCRVRRRARCGSLSWCVWKGRHLGPAV